MTRNITITEGRPDPDNMIDIWAGHVVGEWQVMPVLSDGDRDPSTDWPVEIIEEWLLEQIGDLPETIDEARDDPRVYVSDPHFRDPSSSPAAFFDATVNF